MGTVLNLTKQQLDIPHVAKRAPTIAYQAKKVFSVPLGTILHAWPWLASGFFAYASYRANLWRVLGHDLFRKHVRGVRRNRIVVATIQTFLSQVSGLLFPVFFLILGLSTHLGAGCCVVGDLVDGDGWVLWRAAMLRFSLERLSFDAEKRPWRGTCFIYKITTEPTCLCASSHLCLFH